MEKNYTDFLRLRLDKQSLDKLCALGNSAVIDFVGEYVELCKPKSVFVRTDSEKDIVYIRNKSIANGEETPLSVRGHTLHFDGPADQARDPKNTNYLLPKGKDLGRYIDSIDKAQGEPQVKGYLAGIMKDKEMFICFFCLGPINSEFSILALQITDSAYVAHSEDILYRPGYEAFKKSKKPFFKFVHSAGQLQGGVSKNTAQRRVYMDLEQEIVYSVNTQYAGNTVGLKKLALRLAINRASREGWLAEHMFVMRIGGAAGKKAYFCGAYPSMCGKTSTAMLEGESIIGDDIAYLRIKDGRAFAVNVERGIFGIIKGINSCDDEILFNALSKEGEIIFSNILVDENKNPFWEGRGGAVPAAGTNFSGDWHPGKTDKSGVEISASHKNARFTLRMNGLENVDENLDNPGGVEVKGLIYGGRDSDTSVPVEQALSWPQGIITKAASLESETTAATLGKEGIRVFNPMSNIEFLSIPIGKYIDMNLEFGCKLKTPPLIFSVNYFLKDKRGMFFNDIQDKHVWLKWMRRRVDGKAEALVTPTGLIPQYEDLKELFIQVTGKNYTMDNYVQQFTLRVKENLAKIERIRNIYEDVGGAPRVLFEELTLQQERLEACRNKFGDYVRPEQFQNNGRRYAL